MSKPSWLSSQLDDRARTADALGAAADQSNVCREIASGLHEQGVDHFHDPAWRAALTEYQQRADVADMHGLDAQDIGDEAARRRS